ncbi:hypothetical protein B0H14DRAFT_3549491 [Mycena olivaceomarginata]|nr:hypothetical protein B0H14DRAFT_3549491 [Mycena olivaceomarginata]
MEPDRSAAYIDGPMRDQQWLILSQSVIQELDGSVQYSSRQTPEEDRSDQARLSHAGFVGGIRRLVFVFYSTHIIEGPSCSTISIPIKHPHQQAQCHRSLFPFLSFVPSWNDTRGSSVSRATSVHPLVKKEARVVVLPLDNDSDNIQIRWSAGGAVNLKEQHPDVQKSITKQCAEILHQNSILCAAEDLHLPNIASAVVIEVNGGRALSKYGEALAVVPQGRISSFRGIAKSTAKAGLYGNYKVQTDCVARVEHLMKGQAFIYKQKPDTLDPRSQIIVFGRPDTDTPYLHDAIADGVGGFLKTKTAERCADMWKCKDNLYLVIVANQSIGTNWREILYG